MANQPAVLIFAITFDLKNDLDFFSGSKYETKCQVKIKDAYSGSRNRLTTTGTRVSYGITQYYLPPDRVDVPAITSAEAGTVLAVELTD